MLKGKMSVMCFLCEKVFSSQSNLNKHLRNVHKQQQKQVIAYEWDVYQNKCLENECHLSFRYVSDLRLHLEAVHKKVMEKEDLEFSNIEDFKFWLCDLHMRQGVEYISHPVKLKGIVYYNCNRSGRYVTKDERSRKRLLKSQGSNKLNSVCTSQILFLEKRGKYYATYHKTHSHKIELQHIRISKQEKVDVATKLESGITIKKVLDDARSNIDITDLNRIDLITRKDVQNIKNSFHLENNEGKRHKEDSLSIDLWVEEQKNNENNCVLFYKRQGDSSDIPHLQLDDFCLIIMNKSQEFLLKTFGSNIVTIDNTHGLNPYDFYLTTLMILDEFNEGSPGACMFSNRQDSTIYYLFFSKIMTKVGLISPKVFMSDITDVFYKAWNQIMGTPEYRLFCSWHIDRAWKAHLNKITKLEKKKFIYKTIKYLQTTLDQDEFENGLGNAIELFVKDRDTKEFGEYFHQYYSQNVEMWAYCYRKGCGVNTNMHIESMHKCVKYFYLEGKCVQRLDKGLHAVLNYIRDKIVQRIIKNIKGKNNSHVHKIMTRHRISLNSSFDVETKESGVYQISSAQQTYIVRKNIESSCCMLMCQYCHICVHSYTCECTDFFIHNTICKHIHFIAFNEDESNKNTYKVLNDEDEVNLHMNSLQDNVKKQNILEIKGKINNALDMIRSETDELVKNNNIESLCKIYERVNNVKSLVSICKTNYNNSKNALLVKKYIGPSNKMIRKQNTFFSTKKKRKLGGTELSKPTFDERNDLKVILL